MNKRKIENDPEQKSKKKKENVPVLESRLLDAKHPDLKLVAGALYLWKFKPESLYGGDGKRLIINGTSGSGKSMLALDIIRILGNRVKEWQVHNGSESGTGNYSRYIPSPCVFEDTVLNTKALERFKNAQTKFAKKYKLPDEVDEFGRTFGLPKYSRNITRGVLIDDLLSDPKLFTNETIRWLFYVSRNLKTIFVMLTQHWKKIPPPLRNQASHIFCYELKNKTQKKQMWEEVFSTIETEQKFCKIHDEITADFGTLVMDTTAKDKTKSLMWYKHEYPIVPYKHGSDEYREFMKFCYDENWEERESEKKRIRDEEEERFKEEKENKKRRRMAGEPEPSKKSKKKKEEDVDDLNIVLLE